MNIETHFLIDSAVGEIQKALRGGDQPALAVLEGATLRELRSPFYLRDTATAAEFEQRVAAAATEMDLDRLILAVPMISTPLTAADGEMIRFRSPYTGQLRDDHDERDVIVYTVYDVDDGVSCGMVPFDRNPDGTYTFGLDGDPTQIVTIPVGPAPGFPGLAVLREILDEDGVRRAAAPGPDPEG